VGFGTQGKLWELGPDCLLIFWSYVLEPTTGAPLALGVAMVLATP
jgi:hypothetical protein